MDEAEAIARLKNGDISGLEALVRQYQVLATRTAFLITRDRPLAEDIVQNAFIKVYERIYQFDSQRTFGPWFVQIVANDAVKAVSRRTPTLSLSNSQGQEWEELTADSRLEPTELLEQAETRQAVWSALEKLSPDQRATLVMRYYKGLNEKEMAGQLNIPAGTVKSRLNTARQRLRSMMETRWR